MLSRCIRALAVLAFVFSTSAPAHAQGVVLEGRLDCGNWIEARTKRSADRLEHYLIGLLNGMALTSQIEFWQAGGSRVSRDQVFLWMDDYCRRTPLADPVTGAVALMNERTGNAWDQRRR